MNASDNTKVGRIAIIVVGVIVLAGLAVYAAMYPKADPQNEATTTDFTNAANEAVATDTEATDQADVVTITFTDNGFTQGTYTVKKGQAVMVKNDSAMDLQFSSDDHPAHRDNAELNMSTLSAGQSGVFTPTKIGIWGFHDHINSQYVGELVVVE